MDGERAIGENLKIRPVEQIVVHERAACAEFDATDFTQIDICDLLVIGCDATIADTFSDLLEKRLSGPVTVEQTVLTVVVFVTARLGDDVLDARLVENERCRVLRHIDLRTIGNHALGASAVRTTAVVSAP